MSDDSLWFRPPPRPSHPPAAPRRPPSRARVEIVIDGQAIEGAGLLDDSRGVPLAGDRHAHALLPGKPHAGERLPGLRGRARRARERWSRPARGEVESGMDIKTDSPRVRLSRKMVLEFLGSSVDLSTAPQAQAYAVAYGACPERYGPPQSPARPVNATPRAGASSRRRRGAAETVAQPVKVDNDLYVRDYSKCILCYKCVEACGTDAQNTFAIAVAGRGFDARISTEGNVPLPDSACVYCGNCIGVCPDRGLDVP